MKYSIVIPTYNHCDDLLKPCIESIVQYSDMENIQLIVVANGCTDNTKDYLESLGSLVETIWFDEAMGYTKATNAGIKKATGEFTVLLNNDTVLLSQNKDQWLKMLEAPMTDSKTAMTGPLMLHDDYANADVLIFFCVMIRTQVFSEVGILDEIFTPGGGEDIDFSVRLEKAGYKIKHICDIEYISEKATNVGNFPIWHKDNQTFKHIPEYSKHIMKRNGLINCKRYNKNIKLNLGSAGVDYPGYLSVDFYDQRAQVIMDITKLDFDENSVEEILASHVFEHLNPYKTLDILKDWLRVLKPGGKLIMEMPDIEQLCKNFATADYWGKFSILNVIYGSVNTTDSGDPSDITSPHLFGWWPESLNNHLVAAGYTNIQFMAEKIPHPANNLRVEATKPAVDNNYENYLYSLSNNYERAVFLKNDVVFPREATRYLWAANHIVGTSVFELGCSTGYGIQFLPKQIEYTGLDYDNTIIQVASEQNWLPAAKFINADINTFDLGFYDTIIAFEVIEHLDNGLEIVEKLKKHCKRLLISVPYKETPGFWGEHHKLHMLDESHLPGFEYKYIDRDGNINDTPLDPLMNLMLCKYDA
jgi:GT2 family glycosyltransferase/SAM-dependent methyltransferase